MHPLMELCLCNDSKIKTTHHAMIINMLQNACKWGWSKALDY